MDQQVFDALRTAAFPRVDHTVFRQENRLTVFRCSQCQIRILKIHEKSVVKTAYFFEYIGSYYKKTACTKLYLNRLVNHGIGHGVFIYSLFKDWKTSA